MELKLLIKNTSYLVTTKIVQFIIGIIRSKLIAVILGTLGAGIIAQLTAIVHQMSSFTLMGLNDGLVKQISEQRVNDGFRNILAYLLKSYLAIIIPITILSLTLVFIFSKEITIYVFGDIKYYNYLLIGLTSLPILIINSISFALLKGFKQIKYIARSQLFVILIDIVLLVPLIYFGGLTGAVIYVPLSLLTMLLVNNHYAAKKVLNVQSLKRRDIISAAVNKKAVKELLLFAGFGITAGAALIISEIACRSIVVTKLGVDQIGIYSPLVTWAGILTGFILPSASTYLYPRLSEANSNEEINGIVNDVLRLTSLLAMPFLFLSIPIRFKIIPLFYSQEFSSAGIYLPWHFIGTLFYLWMYSLALVLAPTGRIKTYGFLVILMSILNFLIVYYFVPLYGLYGWMFKFIISPALFFVFYLVYLKSEINFQILKMNKYVMSYILTFSLLMIGFDKYVTNDYKINLLFGILLTCISFWFLSASEKQYIIKLLQRRS